MDDVGRLWQGLVICVIIIFIMGFFTACENALIEMNDSKVKKLMEEHKRGKVLKKLLSKPNRLVMANLVSRASMIIILSVTSVVYFFNPFRAFLAASFEVSNGTSKYFALSVLTAVVMIFILSVFASVFGIILPRRLCAGGKITDKFAMRFCRIYSIFLKFFRPLEVVAAAFSTLILKILGVKNISKNDSVTEEEILMMVDAVNENGGIEEDQAEMISNIFEFDDREVCEIMTHRTDVVGVDEETSVHDAVRIIIEEGFSRLPVFEGNIDNISGVVFAKDLLRSVFEQEDDKIVRDYMREIKFVPESNSCKELFEFFTAQKKQIAVIVDEYGGTAGIVTMEDLLESIVGNMQDEFDDEEEEIQEITPNTFDISGIANPDEVMESLGRKMPENHDYDTMSGFIIDILGYLPDEHESPIIKWEDVTFSIIKVSTKRVEKIRAVIKSDKDKNISEDSDEKE